MKKIARHFIFLIFILMITIAFTDKVEARKVGGLNYCEDGNGNIMIYNRIHQQTTCAQQYVSFLQMYGKKFICFDDLDAFVSSCERFEPNCAYVRKYEGCLITEEPTSSSVACSRLEEDKCQLRMDCEWLNGKCKNNSYYNEKIHKIQKGETGIEIEDIIQKTSVKKTCSDVKELTGVWLFLRVVSPFIIILFGSLDFLKATLASDEKKMKEAKAKFPKRLIAFILFIVLPFIIQFIFKYVGTYGSQNVCLIKCIVTNDTSSKGCE